MTDLDLEAFRSWLSERRGRHGRALPVTTINVYVRAAAAIARDGSKATRYGSLLGAARQLQQWPACPKGLAPVLEELRAAGPATHGRAKPARSIPEKTWGRFTRALDEGAASSPAVAVLKVLADTGLRIGDVLRVPLAELRAGSRGGRMDLTVKGHKERIIHWDGAPEAWGALLEHAGKAQGARTIAEVVSPGSTPHAGGAAYKACARAMAAVGEKIDPDERWHLHRMRRTVLVQALEETGDLAAVQQLGGHDHVATTARYLDEVRAKETAELQRKLAARRKKG